MDGELLGEEELQEFLLDLLLARGCSLTDASRLLAVMKYEADGALWESLQFVWMEDRHEEIVNAVHAAVPLRRSTVCLKVDVLRRNGNGTLDAVVDVDAPMPWERGHPLSLLVSLGLDPCVRSSLTFLSAPIVEGEHIPSNDFVLLAIHDMDVRNFSIVIKARAPVAGVFDQPEIEC